MLTQRHFPDCAFSPSFSSLLCLFASFLLFSFTCSCIHPFFFQFREHLLCLDHTQGGVEFGVGTVTRKLRSIWPRKSYQTARAPCRGGQALVDPRGQGSHSLFLQAVSSWTPGAVVGMDHGGGEVVSILQSPQGPLPWSTSLRACRDKIKANNAELRMHSVSILAEHEVLGSVPSNV